MAPLVLNADMTSPVAKKKSRISKQAKSKRGSNTRDRIVERSISLFNRRGIQQVAIEHIAADLKMSPGNITYYFPLKRHLIHATLNSLKIRLRQTLEARQIRAVQDAGDYVVSGISTLWDFRFFFNSLVFLLADDPELQVEYSEFRGWAIDAVAKDLEGLIVAGYFHRPTAPNNLHLLADNLWSQWLNWLRMQQIEDPLATMPNAEALYDCALHFWSLCQPHFEPDFAVQLLAEFQNLLLRQPAALAVAAPNSVKDKPRTRKVRQTEIRG